MNNSLYNIILQLRNIRNGSQPDQETDLIIQLIIIFFQMNHQGQQTKWADKLKMIHSSKQMIPDLFWNDLPKQIPAEFSPTTHPEFIRLETFYRITQPVIANFDQNFSIQEYLSPGHNEVLYPVAAVVIFLRPDSNMYYVSLKMIEWIESGGIRCIPLKSSANEKQLENIIKLVHCIIIPDLESKDKLLKISDHQPEIINILQAAHRSNIPSLCLGMPALIRLENLLGKKLDAHIENSEQNILGQFYIPYTNNILKDIQTSSRIHLQNRKKIKLPYIMMAVGQGTDLENFAISGLMKDKNKQVIQTIVESKQPEQYFLFNNPIGCENTESMGVWHKLITNFINVTKSKKKAIKEKEVEKHLIGHHKIIYEENKPYYKL